MQSGPPSGCQIGNQTIYIMICFLFLIFIIYLYIVFELDNLNSNSRLERRPIEKKRATKFWWCSCRKRDTK